jgi:hypothetical protein
MEKGDLMDVALVAVGFRYGTMKEDTSAPSGTQYLV